MVNNWIGNASGKYREEANKYKNLLDDEYTSDRKSLLNTLYSMGLRTGGVSKGMGGIGRSYNENLAGVNRDIASNQMYAQEGEQTLKLQSEIQALTSQYQDALNSATRMRHGAEQQMFDTGAGNQATDYENQAKALRAQIEAKYGQLARTSSINPYTGQIAQQSQGAAGQFRTAALEGEKNISSGSSIGVGKPLALIASMLIPGLQGLTPSLMASTATGAVRGDMNLNAGDALSAVTNMPDVTGGADSPFNQMVGKMASSYKDYFGGNMQADLSRYAISGASPQQIVADLLTKQADVQMQKRMEEQGFVPGDLTKTTDSEGKTTTVQKYSQDYGIETISASDAAKNYSNIKPTTKSEMVDVTDPYTVPIKIEGKSGLFTATARQSKEKVTMTNRKNLFDLRSDYSVVKTSPGKGLTAVAAYEVDPSTGQNTPTVAYVNMGSKVRTPSDIRAEVSAANTKFYRTMKAEIGRGKIDGTLPDFTTALANITKRADDNKWSKDKFNIALGVAVDEFEVTDDTTLKALKKLTEALGDK